MGLRHRSYLREATYGRDRVARKIATDFYEALVKFLKTRSDELAYRSSDGGFGVHAMEFWRHPKARNLGVIFTPSTGGQRMGGMGVAGGLKVVVFPIMLKPGDKSHLATRLNKDVVIHEMIHFLDPGMGKGASSAKRYDSGEEAGYYNSPAEWNAYWQEGAAKFERAFGWHANDPALHGMMIKKFFGDGSLKQAREKAEHFWDQGFLDSMNVQTRRKFDKRFAQLWKAAKSRGDL